MVVYRSSTKQQSKASLHDLYHCTRMPNIGMAHPPYEHQVMHLLCDVGELQVVSLYACNKNVDNTKCKDIGLYLLMLSVRM